MNGKNTYTSGGRNAWSLLLFMLGGIVIGGFAGTTLGQLPYMEWLSYSNSFGITSPLTLDFGIVVIQFALLIKFNIGGIIGLLLGVIVYKRLRI